MNFAIIGCGLIGHKRAKSLNNNTLLYVCDVDFKKQKYYLINIVNVLQ